MGNLPVSKKDLAKYAALVNYASRKLREKSGFHIDPSFDSKCVSQPVFDCIERKCVLSKRGEGRYLTDEEKYPPQQLADLNALTEELKKALYLNDQDRWAVHETEFLKNGDFKIFMGSSSSAYKTADGFNNCHKASDCTGHPAAIYSCAGNLPVSKKDIDKYDAFKFYIDARLSTIWPTTIIRPNENFICQTPPVFDCQNNKCVLSKRG
jgi:hypothetical protein